MTFTDPHQQEQTDREPIYECLDCGNRPDEVDGRLCSDCGGYLSNINKPRNR